MFFGMEVKMSSYGVTLMQTRQVIPIEGIQHVYTLDSDDVSWLSRLQNIGVLSTDTEYAAATKACKEMVWLKVLLGRVGFENEKCTMFSYSQSTLAKNLAFPTRMKHLDIRYHFIHSLLEVNPRSIQG